MKTNELELLKLSQNGDKDATEKLLVEYKHLVVAISRKYYLLGGDKEDLVQEGMIGLFKAITTFDAYKSDNFVSFACTLISREIISAIRRANSHSQQFLSESILLDDEDIISDNVSPESDFLNEEQTHELTQEIDDHLSALERKVVKLYLKGYHYIDIAKMLGKDEKAIDNALSRIKKKLQYLKERL